MTCVEHPEFHEEIVVTRGGDFVLRKAGGHDLTGLHVLWRNAFGREPDPLEWQWKFSGPFGHNTVVCQHEDGTIVAAYPGVPLPVQCHGRTVRLDLLMDSMSDPKFRGTLAGRRGLFVRTAQHYFQAHGGEDKALALYGFPGRRHFALGQYLLGYAPLPQQPEFLQLETSGGGWSWWPVRIRLWDESMGLSLFSEIEQRLRPWYPVAVVRNDTFVAWRFVRHPSKRYRIWLACSLSGKVQGYAVTLNRDSAVRVVDMILPAEERLVRSFLARLRGELRTEAERLELWLPRDHFLHPMCMNVGWESAPEPIGFIAGCKYLATSASGLFDRGFYYSLADTDVD